MANVGQLYYRVLDTTTGEYITTAGLTPAQMYDKPGTSESGQPNLVKFAGAQFFSKLGIQAPAGTRAIINSKNIMIGRTGIYELDEDIAIESLRFVRPAKYQRDEAAIKTAEETGANLMQSSEQTRASALADLNRRYPRIPTDAGDPSFTAYWDQYINIQNNYTTTSYEDGALEYQRGRNGIYTLPDPANIDSDANYEDLYNIVIDYIYD